MIDWIFSQQVVLSGAILLMLLLERTMIRQLSARLTYLLWLLLPLVLLANNLPSALKPQTTFEIPSYVVQLSANSDESFNYHFSVLLWLFGCIGSGLLCVFAHKQHVAFNDEPAFSIKNNELKPVKIVSSAHVASPILIGFLRPKLVLPVNYQQLYSTEQLSMIIEHELCHYRRKDAFFNLLAVSLLCLFWFNPLSWLGYQSYRRLQELACDETVLENKSVEECLAYGKAMLLSIENNQHQLYAYTHYTEKRTMLNRLNFIKNRSSKKPFVQFAMLTLITGLLGGVAVAGDHATKEGAQADSKVSPIMRIEPKYPADAVAQKIEGSVVLKYDINPAGQVKNVSVVSAQPEKVFEKNATVALEQWQYKATTQGAQNLLVQLDFLLSEESKQSDLLERIKVVH
ncbi:M56 family metallopeptidase [Pseudoalteromonas tunicata]|uniref:M56 family metallopeptidase n=1 Tax=Pseudoalteromonas tunicata TaxID=314281 RepID=UPI00273E7BD8|nr:M56 family metallopeptidase [Pseudoalteromonas tunicata]MDP4984678.1 M56 family metallopeptidase [Pseudoalteromonas tunicata]MDP5213588.1 TonB family protein [Pseudoalteromonas tunicata]